MRPLLYATLSFVLIFGGCKKEDTSDNCELKVEAAPASETNDLREYLESNGIQAELHEKGFYYILHDPGTGAQPDGCSQIRVNYIGKQTNGDIFDQGQKSQFQLGGLVPGWQAGVPLMRANGKITLYLPPYLGYGSKGSNSIPPNAILIFSIDLLEVN